ncbi:MAG: cupin-like domain-containing protein [Alphaproteobacteria bacterium]|nr:cupin-like domain-containing protein [Alphaproteobacteria bacterium]
MTALPAPRPIAERGPVDRAAFDAEIRPAGRPVVLRGQAADWPAVAAARASDEEFVAYLKSFRRDDRPVGAIVGQPEIAGRFFYTDDMKALNFTRGTSPLFPFLDRLLRDRDHAAPIAMAVQSEPVPELLPGFERANPLPLVAADVTPRAWLGNRVRVAAHYDLMENVGVVVAGRRRFTLFPPDQLPNLYPGPFELTPAGTPVSLVDLAAPDLARFPRYAAAAAEAETATLAPGDALYIPFHWWHAVDSLAPLNLLVNYWWNDATRAADPATAPRGYDALLHALHAFKGLPADQKAVWRMVFDHYVFDANGDPAGHLPAHAQGILAPMTPEQRARVTAMLRRLLARS